MDRSPKSPHRPFMSSVSQETPYVPYQNPHSQRPSSPYGRSLSTSGSSSPRLYGQVTPPGTPPGRPSSPSRHHRRTHSAPRPVKETLDAEFQEDDGVRRVNHYILKREIGRGSFGVVHLGVDSNTGEEFAVKEFSKSKLRKRSQSMILRRTHTPGSANPRREGSTGGGRPEVVKRRSASDIHIEHELADPLYLVRGEIAIMKKLNHENVVKLIEVLDDPTGDSLYMVIEYCKHGPVMEIGLEQKVTPYTREQARNIFRDLILGIEYRTILTLRRANKNANDVLKVVDFGVSEMFTKDNDRLKSSTGSPAFASPELSLGGLHNVSGKAADIWAMGVTLYALIYGVLPFNNQNILELYDNIRNQQSVPSYPLSNSRVDIPKDEDPNLVDLFGKILDKNPDTRIKMPELREHPWVTVNGEDRLLSTEENTAEMVTHVTEKDYADAIKGIRGVMSVVRAVTKLKSLRHQHSKQLHPDSPNPESTTQSHRDSSHRHTKSLDIERDVSHLHPYQQHPIRSFFHDHLGIQNSPENITPSEEIENPQEYDTGDIIPITDSPIASPKPPLTPTIQVQAPSDEPDIKYIGVGLGTTVDKKHKSPGPVRAQTEPALLHRTSSDSVRSDSSFRSDTSGQLTPSEPVVYASPVITHENVFEHAFQRAEDKIRLQHGEHTFVYDTWRSEEMKGQPITNQNGREKVELERIEDDALRWEKILKEKFPEKLREIHAKFGMKEKGENEEGEGSEESSTLTSSIVGKVLGSKGQEQKDEKKDVKKDEKKSRSRWGALLGNIGQQQHYVDTVKSAVDSVTTPDNSEQQQQQGQKTKGD